jgi:intergrase/recombinase
MAQKKKTNRIGNKQNSYLNGEWCKHMKKFGKTYTSHIRRMIGKKEIVNQLND